MDGFIAISIFFWCMATLMSYIFATDPGESFLKRIHLAIRIDLRRSAGFKVIPSVFQAISIYWILLGLVINWIGDAWFKVIFGEVLFGIFLIAPILAFIIIIKKREGKGGK